MQCCDDWYFSSWPPCRIPLQDQWALPAGRSRLHIQPPCDLAVYLRIWVCDGHLRAPRLIRTLMSGSLNLSALKYTLMGL